MDKQLKVIVENKEGNGVSEEGYRAIARALIKVLGKNSCRSLVESYVDKNKNSNI